MHTPCRVAFLGSCTCPTVGFDASGYGFCFAPVGRCALCRVRIRNALQKVCLAGGHLATQLNAALVAMDASHCENFVILMANIESQTYRALYALDSTTGEVRVWCVGARWWLWVLLLLLLVLLLAGGEVCWCSRGTSRGLTWLATPMSHPASLLCTHASQPPSHHHHSASPPPLL